MVSTGELQQRFTGFLLTLCNLFQKTQKEEIFPCSLLEASVTLIPKPCRVQERMLEPTSLRNSEAEILDKVPAGQEKNDFKKYSMTK